MMRWRSPWRGGLRVGGRRLRVGVVGFALARWVGWQSSSVWVERGSHGARARAYPANDDEIVKVEGFETRAVLWASMCNEEHRAPLK